MTIFLDVDGVLNQLQYLKVDNKCVKCLGEICKELNADVVLTTSWRAGYSRRIEDCTPQVRELVNKLSSVGVSVKGRTKALGNRGEEVEDYCCRHGIVKYVVLDDDKSLFIGNERVGEKLYIVNGKTGLTGVDVKKIIKLCKKR